MDDLEDRKRYQEIERADRAKAVLENPLFTSAFEDLEKEILTGLENTHDEALVKKLHLMFVLNRKLKNILAAHIETGKLAALQLEEKRKFKLPWSSN